MKIFSTVLGAGGHGQALRHPSELPHWLPLRGSRHLYGAYPCDVKHTVLREVSAFRAWPGSCEHLATVPGTGPRGTERRTSKPVPPTGCSAVHRSWARPPPPRKSSNDEEVTGEPPQTSSRHWPNLTKANPAPAASLWGRRSTDPSRSAGPSPWRCRKVSCPKRV